MCSKRSDSARARRKAKNFSTGIELCRMIATEAYREYVLKTGKNLNRT